ncbi:long-chain fatty acid--CoA ligase [soil metagenome]
MTTMTFSPVAGWPRHRAGIDAAATAIDDGSVLLSYGDLLAQTDSCAEALVAAGYRAGDRIATLTRNRAEHFVLFFACASVGVALVPLSWRLSDPELRAQLTIADPAALVASADLLPRAATLHPRTGDLTQPPAPVDSTPDDSSGLLIVFTSGTEGTPKAAVLTAAGCRASAESLASALPFGADDVVLGVLPQYHAAGWNTQPLLALASGSTLLLHEHFDAGLALEAVERRGVSAMMGVPSTWSMMARHPRFPTTEVGTLRHAVVGGAPAPAWLLRAWHDRGVDLRQGYGLTEAGPNVLCQTADDARRSPGAAGRPYALVQAALDPRGELLVRGPAVFGGYFRDPAATATALAGGWLHTGDLATMDDDGQYRIIDRLKDIYISGGENVAPAEVEAVLMEHPAVAEAAVIGVPDETWGEVGIAHVVLASPVGAEELLAHCREHLAAFKIPRAVEFVDELPHSGIDKVVRRRLESA